MKPDKNVRRVTTFPLHGMVSLIVVGAVSLLGTQYAQSARGAVYPVDISASKVLVTLQVAQQQFNGELKKYSAELLPDLPQSHSITVRGTADLRTIQFGSRPLPPVPGLSARLATPVQFTSVLRPIPGRPGLYTADTQIIQGKERSSARFTVKATTGERMYVVEGMVQGPLDLPGLQGGNLSLGNFQLPTALALAGKAEASLTFRHKGQL